MEKQYCKVGTITPIIGGNHSISILKYHYENFLNKAIQAHPIDSKLAEFFERKAQNFKKIF